MYQDLSESEKINFVFSIVISGGTKAAEVLAYRLLTRVFQFHCCILFGEKWNYFGALIFRAALLLCE